MNSQWLLGARWAVSLCILATCASGLSANTFDVEAFKSANVEQQREILRTSIETWLAGLRNCQFTSTTRSGERVVNGGKVEESDDWGCGWHAALNLGGPGGFAVKIDGA